MSNDEAAAAIEAFLRALGHDPTRGDLRGTGARVADLFENDLLDGHRIDVPSIFADAMPATRGQPIIVVKGIATHVVCPHHLTIGAGHADVAYLPRDRVLGLGDVARLVDALAHRLALQEDVTKAIAHALVDGIDARGSACAMRLRHGCLSHHGAKKRGASVTTIAFAGSCEDGDDRALALTALAMEGPRSASNVVTTPTNAKRAKKAGN